MTIKYRLENTVEENDYLSFRIYGPDTADSTVREAIVETTVSEWGTAENWLDNNQTEAQNLIDASDITNSFTTLREAKNFLDDNPAAVNLLELGPDELEAAIDDAYDTNNTDQLALLDKALSYAVRVFYRERGEED